ncbi:hypothetical protein V4F39_05185 [Aquincola sp. MAHUQ-54]|uniref:Uncharacterized protein n=1 Tax=Aquincola agrisoli TaxID=3119538 RepID=A0AAW9Q9B0_9BURK
MGASLRFAWRALPLLLAGVVLLALFQVHGAIVRQALRLLGVGSAEPTVLMVADGCGHAVWLPPALAVLAGQEAAALQSDCAASGQALVLMPKAAEGVLFVNGEPFSGFLTGGRLAWFSGLRWRPGANLVSAWPVDERLRYPLPARGAEGANRQLAVLGSLSHGSDALRALLLVADLQLAAVVAEPARASASAPAPAPALDVDEGASGRRLELARDAQGRVAVEAEACLRDGHPVLRDAPALPGPELLGRLFTAMVIGPPRAASDLAWRRLPRAAAGDRAAGSPCTPVRTAYVVEQGEVTLFKSSDFLDRDGDRLVLRGFGDTLRIVGRAPQRVEADTLEWTGAPDHPDWQLVILGHEAARQAAPAVEAAASAAPPSVAASAAAPAERRQGLLVALADLRHLLPPVWTATAWALAAAAPAALILWALRRGWPAPRPARVHAAHTGLVALLAFMAAFALQPVLLQLTRLFVGAFGFLNLAGVPMPGVPAGDLSAPIALCAALLVVPILRGAGAPRGGWLHRVTASTAALLAVGLLLAALGAHRALQLLSVDAPALLAELPGGWLPDAADDPASARGTALMLLLGAWGAGGLLLFWTATYWLFRVAVPAAPVIGAAVGAGLLLFALPLTQGVADLAWVAAIGLGDGDPMARAMVPGLQMGDPAIALVSVSSGAFVVLVVVVLLRAFREVAAAMLSPAGGARLRRVLRTRWLLLAALVIVWPMVDRSWAQPQILHATTFQLMSFFQAFGALLAVLVPLAVAQEHEAGRLPPLVGPAAPPFLLPAALVGLMAATFAGYLSLWNREPLAVALVMVAGWAVFMHGIVDRGRGAPAPPAPGLAQKLAAHMAESRLLRSRRASVEKLFGEGRTSAAHLHAQRAEIDKAQRVLDQALGMPQDEARRRLFFHGPGETPLGNARRAALAGIAVGLFLQLLVQFQWAGAAASTKSTWLTALGKFVVVDPQYRVIAHDGSGSRVLAFCGELLNAMAVWAVAGFLFGYVFHLIRGRDGFMRAAVFGMGITVPYLLSQALVSGAAGVPVQTLLRVVPLLVFLLAAGALLFDGARLRNGGVSIARLPEIYGLKTSVGYLSFAGLLAGVQPLLDLLGWLSGK